MEKYLDAFLYVANWGTHWMMLRLPCQVLDLATARRYCRSESARVTAKGELLILSFGSEDESGDGPDVRGEVLGRIMPAKRRADGRAVKSRTVADLLAAAERRRR
jgi:hypothetical protein